MTDRPKGQTGGPDPTAFATTPGVTEEIEVRGHIVDSLLLPKILDRILLMGGAFEIRECKIGVHRADPSYARIAIRAENQETLDAILGDLVEHGASPIHPENASTVAADIAGAFPEGFYSTTNQPTEVRLQRPLGRGHRPGDGLRDRGRARRCQAALHSDESSHRGHADRGWTRRRARAAGGTAAQREPVRLHELHRLEREAESDQRQVHRRRHSRRLAPKEKRCCWSADRRSCTPGRRRRSPGSSGRAGCRCFSRAMHWPRTTSSRRCSAPAWASRWRSASRSSMVTSII